MKEKQIREWTKLREKGIINYMFKYGIPFFGIPVGVLIFFMNNILNYGYEETFTLKSIVGNGIGGILYGVLIGIVYSLLSWRTNEKKWSKKYEELL